MPNIESFFSNDKDVKMSNLDQLSYYLSLLPDDFDNNNNYILPEDSSLVGYILMIFFAIIPFILFQQPNMSTETEFGNMQAGIQQLLPDLTTLSLLGHRSHSQSVIPSLNNMQTNGEFF